MRRFLNLLFSVLILFGISSLEIRISPVSASDQFRSSIRVDYSFDANGRPLVTQYISLTNRFSAIYASSYQFTVTGTKPENLNGKDRLGPLKISVESHQDNSSLITVYFNEQIVGKDQTYNFSLSYLGEPAVHHGQVWEISLPRVSSSELFESYDVSFSVPSVFGRPAFISPSPYTVDDHTYYFHLTNSSEVKAAFGDFQSFTFQLEYDLKNSSSQKQLIPIPLPPDTDYQHLFYSSINPSPQNVYSDSDGNWLAQYTLSPHQSIKIIVSGQAHVQPYPIYLPLAPSHQDLQKYLQPLQYWPSSDPQIISLAKKYSTPAEIYKFVVDTLSYDPNRVINNQLTRRGALAALSAPQNSICTDFTDLFIAIARAAGIPSRELSGYAYTNSPQIQPLDLSDQTLHTWPEYWDASKKIWISIDPTWEKTTGGIDYFNQFDFNHLVFAIHGQSSTLPLPAGLYAPNSSTKTVQVSISPYRDFTPAIANFNWHKPPAFLPMLTTKSILEIQNLQGQAIYNLPVEVVSQNLSLTSPVFTIIPVLPPFSKYNVPITFSGSFLPDFSAKYLSVQVGEQQLTYNISTNLFIFWHVGLVLIIVATFVGLAFITTKAWSLYLQRQLRSDHLRRQSHKS